MDGRRSCVSAAGARLCARTDRSWRRRPGGAGLRRPSQGNADTHPGREAFVCQHVGDLSDAETFRFYEESAAHLLSLLDVRPDAFACDLHPDYLSTRFAEDSGFPVLKFQHHAAHVAAIAAEHGERDLLGAGLDGTGLGDDGQAWGGEVLRLEGGAFSRLGHLAPLPLIGGDRAARDRWRMGVSAFAAIGRLGEAKAFFASVPEAGLVAQRGIREKRLR